MGEVIRTQCELLHLNRGYPGRTIQYIDENNYKAIISTYQHRRKVKKIIITSKTISTYSPVKQLLGNVVEIVWFSLL